MNSALLPSIQSALHAALEEARKFIGATAPNPPVGAAAIDAAGNLIGVQAHERAGTGHAEARLIQKLIEQGRIHDVHTLVVTLEPCNHQGSTPPCSEAILGAKITRVVYGVKDPNPNVAGKGAEKLKTSGVQIFSCLELMGEAAKSAANPLPGGMTATPDGVSPLAQNAVAFAQLHSECAELIRPFAHWARTGMPWVVVKTAHREQDSMLPPPGQKTFTSPDSLKLAHELRKRADAIFTGSGTVLADLPEFTVRHVADHEAIIQGLKKRRLVVLDRRGRLGAVLANVTPSHPWLKAAESRGFEVLIRQDFQKTLQELGKLGTIEVLIEAGPSLSSSILSSSLWNQHVLITQGIESSTGREPDTVHVVENVHWHHSKSR